MRQRPAVTRLGHAVLSVLLALVSLTCRGDELVLPSEAEPKAIAILRGEGQVGTVGLPLPDSLVVRITDSRDRPVVDLPVAFVTMAPGGGQLIPDTATTNADGRAAVRWVLGTVRGSYGVEARIPRTSGLTVAFQASALSAAADTLLLARGDNQVGQVNGPLPDPLVVRANDRFGNPVPGVIVGFEAVGGGSVSAAADTTGQNGEAAVARVLGPTAGPQSATARVDGLKGSPVTFVHTAGSEGPANLVKVSGDAQTSPAGLALADSLVVRLVDINGNGVPGVQVGFAVATGGGSVSPAAVTTNAQGRAAASWTLGAVAGPNSLIASAAGFSVTFNATGTADVPTTIAVNAGNGQNAVAGAAVTVPPSVIVRDGNGNGVPGVAVTFAVTSGGGSVVPTAPVATNGSGIAAVASWTLGTVAGTNTLRASASGPSGPLAGSPVTFTATGTVGPAAKLTLTQQPSPSAQTGVPFAVQPVVRIQDANGNNVSQAGTTVTAAIDSGPAGATLIGTQSQITNASGQATFSGLGINGPAGTYRLRFFAGAGLTPAVSDQIGIGVGSAVQLAFVVQPTNVVAGAAIAPAVQVAIQDAGGNTVTSATNPVTIAIGNNPGGAILGGTTTIAAVNGVATFSTLSLNRTGTGYTLAATATGLTAATSAAFTVTPGAPSQLVFTQPPTNTTAGAAISPPVQVTVQDALGNTVPTYATAIAMAIGTNPAGGTLAGVTSVTPVNGVASFTNLSIDRAGNGYTLRASSGTLPAATSAAFNVTAGSGNRLAFTVQPSNAQAGSSIAPPIQVAIQDGSGNTVPGATNAVTLVIASNPGSGTLGGQTTVSAVNGIATFTNVNINRVGSGYTLTALASGLVSATSNAFNITPGPAAQLAFTVQPSAVQAGASITPAVQVSVQDGQGNTVTTATNSITVALGANPGGGTLSGTLTRNAVNGVATFTGLSINKTGSGYSLTASATGLASAGSVAFDVTPGAPIRLTYTVQPSNTAAGQAIAPAVEVTILDANDNVVTTSSASVTVALGANPGGGTLGGTTTVNAVAGEATFSTLNINRTGNGYTLVASSAGLTGATSSAFNITPGAPNRLAFTQQPGNTAAGASITPAVQVTIQDALGNTVTTATNLITLAIGTNPGGGTLSGTTSVNAVSGVATFGGLSIDKTGTGYTLTASAGGLTGATSTAFNITPGTPTQLGFTAQPTNTVAGQGITPAVQVAVQDAQGNTVTTATNAITVAIGTNPGGGTLSGTTVVNAVSGIATFSGLSINRTGEGYTLSATSGALTAGTSTTFNITPGAANRLGFVVQPSTAASGAPIAPPVQVAVQDALGNTVTTATNSIAMAIGTNPAGGVLSGTTPVSAVNGIATFSNLSIDKAGTGYTLSATSAPLTAATSNAFNVTAGTATQVTLTTQPSAAANSGAALAQQPVAQLRDGAGNPVSQSGVLITATFQTTPGGTPSLQNATATTNASGQATFSGLAITGLVGNYTLSFAGPSLTAAISNTIVLSAGTATQVTLTTQPSAAANSGAALAQQPVAQLRDGAGNAVSQSGVVITATFQTTPGGTPSLQNATATTIGSGQATFSGLAITGLVGNYTLSFAGPSLTAAISNTIVLSAGAPATVTITTQPSAAATSGAAFAQQPVVEVRDGGGNLLSSVSVTAAIASGTGGSLVGAATVSTNGSGVATYTNLGITGAGPYTLTFTAGSAVSAPSNTVTVS